jgi:hypothetical protein
LEKGSNFVVTPMSIPIEILLCAIEVSVSTLQENEVEEVMNDGLLTLINAKLPNHNINIREATTLRSSRYNKEIMIMRVDKINETIIMNTHEYQAKMYKHLTTKGCYIKIRKNPRLGLSRM